MNKWINTPTFPHSRCLCVLQVFSWGSNMCGQLGHVNSPVTVPQQAKVLGSVSHSHSCVFHISEQDCLFYSKIHLYSKHFYSVDCYWNCPNATLCSNMIKTWSSANMGNVSSCTLCFASAAVRWSSCLGSVSWSEPLRFSGWWWLRAAGPVVLRPAERAAVSDGREAAAEVTQQGGKLHCQTRPAAPLHRGLCDSNTTAFCGCIIYVYKLRYFHNAHVQTWA